MHIEYDPFEVHREGDSKSRFEVAVTIDTDAEAKKSMTLAFKSAGEPIRWVTDAGLLITAFASSAAMSSDIYVCLQKQRMSRVLVVLTSGDEEVRLVFPYKRMHSIMMEATKAGCQPFNYEQAIDTAIERILADSAR